MNVILAFCDPILQSNGRSHSFFAGANFNSEQQIVEEEPDYGRVGWQIALQDRLQEDLLAAECNRFEQI